MGTLSQFILLIVIVKEILTNTYDCGVYAIANAVSILHELDPRKLIDKTIQLI